MYCVDHGRVCIQVWNPRRDKWEYIPERKWQRISTRARARYVID